MNNAVLTKEITLKNRLGVAIIVFLGGTTFVSNVSAEEKLQRLTGQQIRAKFAGMELTDEAHWGEVFERNGTLRRLL